MKKLKLCSNNVEGPGALICASVDGFETSCGIMLYDGSIANVGKNGDNYYACPKDGKITRMELRELAAKIPEVDKFMSIVGKLRQNERDVDDKAIALNHELRALEAKVIEVRNKRDSMYKESESRRAARTLFYRENHPLLIKKGKYEGSAMHNRHGNDYSIREHNGLIIFGIGCKRLTRDQLIELHKLSEAVGSGKIKVSKIGKK